MQEEHLREKQERAFRKAKTTRASGKRVRFGGFRRRFCQKTMARYLIVDAHSVIHAWPELRTLHFQRMVLARDALLRALAGYHDLSGVRVVVVFDGQGARPSGTTEPGGIQVFYSGGGMTADGVVERLVARYAREHEITVATDDQMEADTATGFGATCVSTDLLRMMVRESDAGLERELKRLRREAGR